MKKVIAVILAAIMVMSMWTVTVFADGDTGNFCADSTKVLDENGNEIKSIKFVDGDAGNIGGKGAKTIQINGWFADDDEFTDIGWSTNDGEITWGCGFEREDLNSTNTAHEYFMGMKVEMEIGEGASCISTVYALYEDGPAVLREYTYVNKTTDIAVERELAVIENGELVLPQTISLADKNESGKDWIGIFASTSDVNNLTEADYLGYKKYVEGTSTEFTLASFKQEGAQELTSGKYIIALLENDSYKVLASTTIKLLKKEETVPSYYLTGNDVEYTAAAGSFEVDEETGDVLVSAADGSQAWIQAYVEDYIDDPTDYPYGCIVVDWATSATGGGHIGFYTNVSGNKMENDTKLVEGVNNYSFPIDYTLEVPTFPFFNNFGEATIKGLCFFSTYEEYQYFLENGTLWTDITRTTPTPVPATPTPAPTEAPEDSATSAPAATTAPAKATNAPAADDAEEGGNTGLVIGIVAAVVVVAAAAAVIIIKKKKK